MYRHLYTSPDGHISSGLLDDNPVAFLDVSVRHVTRFPASASAYRAVTTALSAAGLLRCFQGGFYIKTFGEWTPIVSVEDAVVKLDGAIVLARTPNPDFIMNPRVNNRANEAGDFPEFIERLDEVSLMTMPRAMGNYFVKRDDSAVPAIAGFLSHPVHGTPAEDWLELTRFAGEPAESTERLSTLFSAFGLDDASHFALYGFLLGAFHHVSLDCERPILIVDSWKRGRGKSEVSNVINYLLSGQEQGITMRTSKDEMKNELLAFLGNGGRVVTVHNIESNKPAWSNDMLAALATDGAIGGRMKYGRTSVHFKGVLPIINTIYGSASLSKDLIDRAWRVELRGEPAPLSPRPIEYAKEYRDEILCEIMGVHERAAELCESYDSVTRMAPFERVAVASYTEAFNESSVWTPQFCSNMAAGRAALSHDNMCSLYKAVPDAFEDASDMVRRAQLSSQVYEPTEGATALGYKFTGKTWEPLAE